MAKRILCAAFLVLGFAAPVHAQFQIPSTALTRLFLLSKDQATAQAVLGLTTNPPVVVNQTFNNVQLNVISNYQDITVNTNVNFNQNITVKGNATINNLIISNSIQPISHVWSGPTNTIDLTYLRQHFTCSSDISVTGFIHKSPAPTNAPFVLKVLSSVGSISNCTLRLPANFIDLNYGTSYTFTNGIILSGEFDPNLGLTNGVARVW